VAITVMDEEIGEMTLKKRRKMRMMGMKNGH
jgi:hypothetical protein